MLRNRKSRNKRPKAQKVKYSGRFSDHIIQGVLIFASVLLAFWLNDLRNQHIERRASSLALEAVVNEIRQNKSILERWTPRHREMFERSEQFLKTALDTATVFNYWQFTDGPVMSEFITYDTRDIIRQTNPRMDLDTRLLINRIYRQQEYVDNALDKLVREFLGQREVFDERNVRENYLLFHILIGDLWGQGQAMIREYETALETLARK